MAFGKKKNQTVETVKPQEAIDRLIMEQLDDNDNKAAKLVDQLKEGSPLIINFETLDPTAANKMLAFFAGACYALEGRSVKINEKTYLFGYEESYGYLVGTHARDKDAITAVMMLCEAAAYYKKKGLTLWDQMIKIYEKYGFYKEGISTITLKGADGAVKMKELLDSIRNNPPSELGGYKVTRVRDYQTGVIVDTKTGKESETGLPKSNVLYYDLEDDAWCCVRPSGTEPKVKFYMGVKGKSFEDSKKQIIELEKNILSFD